MATTPETLQGQDQLLLDYIHRLEQHRHNRKVLHVNLSGLRPFNRKDSHLRAAMANFDQMVSDREGQLFHTKNNDLFFIYPANAQPRIETAIQKLKFMFSDDPLIAEADKGEKKFATIYDAEGQYEDILKMVQDMVEAEEKRQTEVRSRMDARQRLKDKQRQGEPLTPATLARIEEALSRADLSNMVRRQFVCAVDKNMVPVQRFSELFISIQDLRETILPGVNLTSNRWLFQHLTETLDKRVLSMLMKTDYLTLSGEISFNVNVKTVLSDQFQRFDDSLSANRRGGMIIELQKEDIFADLNSYLFAREFVQEKGYRVCLDGITANTLKMIERERLGADLSKLVWSGELADGGEETEAYLRELNERGPEKMVLCRCDTRESIEFGRSVGIRLFQGRYVENLIAEDERRRELLRLKRRIERGNEPREGENEGGMP